MATSKKSGTGRRKQRRTKVSIGGISQSAFAGYAPGGANPSRRESGHKNPSTDNSDGDEKARKKKD